MKRLIIAIICIYTLCCCSKQKEQFPWREHFITKLELAGPASKTWAIEHLILTCQSYNKDSSRWQTDSTIEIANSDHLFLTFYTDGRLEVSDPLAILLGIDKLGTWTNDNAADVSDIYRFKFGLGWYIEVGRYYYKTSTQNELLLLSGSNQGKTIIRSISFSMRAK